MTVAKTRRGGMSAQEARQRPMYAKLLGLQHVRPSNLVCFAFFEGAVALAALLAIAELAEWWAVLVLPLSVAAMVKLNDMIAGTVARAGIIRVPRAIGRARVPVVAGPAGAAAHHAGMETEAAGTDGEPGSPDQRGRQSPMHRYE